MILFTDKEINDILSGIEKKYRKEKAKRSAGSFPSHAIFALSEVKKRINKLKSKKVKAMESGAWGGWKKFFKIFKKN